MKLHYLDSSIIVSFVLEALGLAIRNTSIECLCTSNLSEVEVSRALDRLRVLKILDDDSLAAKMGEAVSLLTAMKIVNLNNEIIREAKKPLPVPVKALDAIHVMTASALKDKGQEIVFCTRDQQQARAARALGFEVKTEFKM